MIRHVLLFAGAALLVAVFTLWWAMPEPVPADLPPLPAVTGPVGELLQETHRRLRESPDDARVWRQHAETLAANRFFDDAVRCYRTGLTLDPRDFRLWYGLGRAEADRSELAPAATAYERASLLRPEDPTPHWRRGFLLLETGALTDARAEFEAAGRLDPASVPARFGLARLDLLEGDVTGARAMLETLCDPSSPYDGYARHLLSDVARRQGDLEQAQTLALSAKREVPPWPDPHERFFASRRPGYGAQMAVARQHLANGDPASAVAILERLEDEHARRPMLRVTLGRAYREANRWRDSVETLETAIRLDETLFAAHFELAVTLGEVGRRTPEPTGGRLRQRARVHAMRAAELNPAYAPAHAVIGDLDLLDGDLEAALNRFTRAATVDDDPRWSRRQGITLVRLERWSEAAEVLSASVAVDATDGEAWRALALSLARLDRRVEARAALDKARGLGANRAGVRAIESLLAQ